MRLLIVLGTSTDLTMRPGMAFPDAGAIWLEQIERPESRLSVRTRADYRGAYERDIDTAGSALRGLTLAQANDAQVLLGALQRIADTKGTETARLCRTILSSITAMAVRFGVLDHNAAKDTGVVKAKMPRTSTHDRTRAFTRAERDAVVAAADALRDAATNPRSTRKWTLVGDLAALMAGTGCRIAEARLLM